VLLYVGSFTPVQGIDKLLQAFPLLAEDIRDVHLIMAGGRWSPSLFRKYKALIRKLKNNITMIESVNYLRDLNKLVNIADITISPKLPTCQSNQKVLVYGAVGKPIVVFRTMANVFLLRDKAFYARELTAEALANAVKEAYDKLSNGSFDKHKLIKYIRDNYSIKSAKLINKIREIMLEFY